MSILEHDSIDGCGHNSRCIEIRDELTPLDERWEAGVEGAGVDQNEVRGSVQDRDVSAPDDRVCALKDAPVQACHCITGTAQKLPETKTKALEALSSS